MRTRPGRSGKDVINVVFFMPLIRPWGHKIRAARMEDGRLGVDQEIGLG